MERWCEKFAEGMKPRDGTAVKEVLENGLYDC